MSDPFTQIVGTYGPRLAHEFGLTPEQNAGIWGNLAHESGAFRFFKQVGSGPNSGGRGFAQWTGSRRIAFLGYCKAHRLEPSSADASYAYLCLDLHGTYGYVTTALKRCKTLDTATSTFERLYEVAGIKAMGSRLSYARKALAVLSPGHPAAAEPARKARKPRAAGLAKKTRAPRRGARHAHHHHG